MEELGLSPKSFVVFIKVAAESTNGASVALPDHHCETTNVDCYIHRDSLKL